MDTIKDFGTKISRCLLDRKLHIRDFLKQLKEKYPDERGLTENGFRYSLKNGTLKISTLAKISAELDMPVDYWFMGQEKSERMFTKNEIVRLEARIVELEQDKQNLQDLIKILKEKISGNNDKNN